MTKMTAAIPADELDAWCKKRAAALSEPMNRHVMAGGNLDDREFRRMLGESSAYFAMRSYIHGAVAAHIAAQIRENDDAG